MISNVPNSIDLDIVARRLYFSAWTQLEDIESAYPSYLESMALVSSAEIEQGRKEYFEAAQPEFQSIWVLVQQSNEFAMKARICGVSPYLLLLRNDIRNIGKPSQIDFSDFRTIDAVDLPAAIKIFCSKPLSDSYREKYEHLRVLRNKLAHLGFVKSKFEPKTIFDILITQYKEFWLDVPWLKARTDFENGRRESLFHNYKHTSPMMNVMLDVPDHFSHFAAAEFKELFGVSKTKLKFACPHCYDNADTRYAGLIWKKSLTAFKLPDGQHLKCLMCDQTLEVEKFKCNGCKDGTSSNYSKYWNRCCHCGEDITQ